MILKELLVKDNASQALENLLNAMGVLHTDTTIAEFENHPHFPSFLAYSDILNGLHIESMALKLTKDQFKDMPTPFITHHNIERGIYIVVTGIENDMVIYKDGTKGMKKIKIDDFLENFSGASLIVEMNGAAVEYDYLLNRRKEVLSNLRWPFICLTIGGILVYGISHKLAYFANYYILFFILFLAYSCGLGISILLLIQTIDKSNTLAKKFCRLTEKVNCNGVLDSPAAKFMGIISWSELGYFYFAGNLLVLLFAAVPVSSLALLNVVALPYTFFSIYYQWKIVQQWCTLCLTIQALLWIIFLSFRSDHIIPDIIWSFNEITDTLLWFCIPVILWIFVRPFINKAAQGKTLKEEINKFKGSEELFYALLKQQPALDIPNSMPTLILGNPDSVNIMTVVTNPYCAPCTEMHKKLEKLLKVVENVLKVQVIFSTGTDEKDERFKVAVHMMSLFHINNKREIREALEYWYDMSKKDFEIWSNLFPALGNGSESGLIKRHSKWCESVSINGTPTIFINGHVFPSIYDLEDLKYII